MDCITRRQFVLMLVDLLVCKQPIESNDDNSSEKTIKLIKAFVSGRNVMTNVVKTK